MKMGPETTEVTDGRYEVQSNCATREKSSRPNQCSDEKENDQKKRLRGGAKNSMEAIFF